MLRRGLERLEDAKVAPLKAENSHELGRSLDVKSIIDNTELVLRSSIERRESRPVPNGFCRAEYPEQDDKNWLCFLAIRKENGAFKFTKLPIE
jgi:succinate dehydrogenase/fumarate reductase flavoprotein subunit